MQQFFGFSGTSIALNACSIFVVDRFSVFMLLSRQPNSGWLCGAITCFFTCAAVFLLSSSEFELTELLHFTASVVLEMICSHMSPVSRTSCFFHASCVTAWPPSDVTHHSPLLLFQKSPSPPKTRGPPPLTLLHGTPPITTTAQNHSTTCRV